MSSVHKICIASELRERIRSRAAASGLHDPVAAIIEGQWDGDGEKGLHLAFYEREQIPKDEEVSIANADGLELLIIQQEIMVRLATGRLELDGGRIVISG